MGEMVLEGLCWRDSGASDRVVDEELGWEIFLLVNKSGSKLDVCCCNASLGRWDEQVRPSWSIGLQAAVAG